MPTPFLSGLAKVLGALLIVYSLGMVANLSPPASVDSNSYELVYPLLYTAGSPGRPN